MRASIKLISTFTGKAAIYTRSASFNEESIKRQIYSCELFAKEKNLKAVEIYSDNGISSRSQIKPSLDKLLQDLNIHLDIDFLIVESFSRLARSSSDWFIIKSILNKTNTKILSVNEQIDDSSSTGKFMQQILMGVTARTTNKK